MNAPDPAVHAAAIMISLDFIKPSATNPRKRFEGMAELTDSVRQHGVLQPILVRAAPLKDSPSILWVIVAGERRWRAAKAAGVEKIAAVVRALTDAEALELQVIENLQRADLHPIEEAEGYEKLMKRHKYSVDDIAAKVGKSRGYVYGRLKLTALCAKVREAFFAGKLEASHALLLARIPVESLQLQAMKDICGGQGGEAVSYRSAADTVHRRYMLRLADASFDPKDADLVKSAGACGVCPKRTGNQPELFHDVKSADVCTDPTCFAAKRKANSERVRVAAIADGKRVITGPAAKKIMPYDDSYLQGGYKRLDSETYLEGSNKAEKVRALVAKVGVETQLVESPKTGDMVEIVSDSALQAALKKAGLIKPRATSSRSASNDNRERQKRQQEVACRKRIFDALCGRLGATDAFSHDDGVLVTCGLWEMASYDTKASLLERWGWVPPADPTKKKVPVDWDAVAKASREIAKLAPTDLWRLMIQIVCYPDITTQSKPLDLTATATRFGVDVEAVRKEAAAAIKAKKTAKKIPVAKTAAKPTRKSTAQPKEAV